MSQPSHLNLSIGDTVLARIKAACAEKHPDAVETCVEHVKEAFANAVDQYCNDYSSEVSLSPIACKQAMLNFAKASSEVQGRLKELLQRHPVLASDKSPQPNSGDLIKREVSLFPSKKEAAPPPPPKPEPKPVPPPRISGDVKLVGRFSWGALQPVGADVVRKLTIELNQTYLFSNVLCGSVSLLSPLSSSEGRKIYGTICNVTPKGETPITPVMVWGALHMGAEVSSAGLGGKKVEELYQSEGGHLLAMSADEFPELWLIGTDGFVKSEKGGWTNNAAIGVFGAESDHSPK